MNAQTISLCMIVRDCETTLGAALDSVRPHVDEMVVVDTGSVDGTADLARQRGAQVFHFPWCDSFSAARNESLDRATGDWVFWLDSDDVLLDGGALRQSVATNPNRDAAFVIDLEEQVFSPDGLQQFQRYGQLKLFPRRPDLRFRYRVHEQIMPAVEEAGLKKEFCQAVVRHAHADRSPAANQDRLKRYRRLLELDLVDHPDDCFVLYNLGLMYFQHNLSLRSARDYLERALASMPQRGSTRINAHLTLAKVLRKTGNIRGEIATCREGLERFPDEANLLVRLAQASELQGQVAEAEKLYLQAWEKGWINLGVLRRQVETQLAAGLGELYQRTGRSEMMLSFWKSFLGKCPDNWQVRRLLIEWLIRQNRTDEAAEQIAQLPAGVDEVRPLYFALIGCVAVQQQQWAPAAHALVTSYQLGFRDPLQLHALSVALMATGQFAPAKTVLLELLQLDPLHPMAEKNLNAVRQQLANK